MHTSSSSFPPEILSMYKTACSLFQGVKYYNCLGGATVWHPTERTPNTILLREVLGQQALDDNDIHDGWSSFFCGNGQLSHDYTKKLLRGIKQCKIQLWLTCTLALSSDT